MCRFRLSPEQFDKVVSMTHLSEAAINIGVAVICRGEKQKDVAYRFNVTQQRVSEIGRIVRAAYLHSENAPDNWQPVTVVLPAKLEKVVKRFVAFLVKSLDTKQPVSEIHFEGFSILIKKEEVAGDMCKKKQIETLNYLRAQHHTTQQRERNSGADGQS